MNDRKKMIMDAFWELLEEMPYNKISVRLIVERAASIGIPSIIIFRIFRPW